MMLESNMWEYFDCCLMRLKWYVKCLSHRAICNHFGWNEISTVRLKGNQCTMVTYVSICFSMIELIWYGWWLSYRLICNRFGWNETSVLRVEMRYYGYTCTYNLQNCWNYMIIVMTEWWIRMQSFWLKRDQNTGDWNEIKIRWLQMDYCEVNEFGIKYESLGLNVKLICIWLENWYLNF